MSDFDNEMDDIANAETGSLYIDKPGTMPVTIKSYKMSPNDHKGVPFVEFTFETLGDEKGGNKATNSTRLYRVQAGDNEQKKAIKQKKLKELLQNAGGDFTKKGEAVIMSIVGKQIQALFKQSEYIGADKNENQKPVIRTKVEYSFSSLINKPINGTQKYLYSTLNAQDQAKFEGLLNLWNRDNGMSAQPQQNNAPTQEEYLNQGAGQPPVQSINPEEGDDSDF